jgi:DNA ligase (NAD+)
MDTDELLADELKKAKEAYYNLTPIMSDQEYDAKLATLKQLRPNHPEVLSVGAPIPTFSVWEKVKHTIPMGSLNKVNSEDEFRKWCKSAEGKELFITHKLDGSSMELVYEGGSLKRCVTRGDGLVGEDVIQNLSYCQSIPKTIMERGSVTIRGEMIMLKSVFEEHYSQSYANPRNTAAAKVREKKNPEECENLTFIGYKIVMDNGPKTMRETMEKLHELGFKAPKCYVCGIVEDMVDVFKHTNSIRPSLEYEIDGMVISINDLEQQEDLGGGMRPDGQIAWKFDHARAQTRVKDIEWRVGKTGRITPVAIVEPVSIGGVTITDISLHNLDMFRELKLSHGCRIIVSKRNDVIPYLEENLDRNIQEAT